MLIGDSFGCSVYALVCFMTLIINIFQNSELPWPSSSESRASASVSLNSSVRKSKQTFNKKREKTSVNSTQDTFPMPVNVMIKVESDFNDFACERTTTKNHEDRKHFVNAEENEAQSSMPFQAVDYSEDQQTCVENNINRSNLNSNQLSECASVNNYNTEIGGINACEAVALEGNKHPTLQQSTIENEFISGVVDDFVSVAKIEVVDDDDDDVQIMSEDIVNPGGNDPGRVGNGQASPQER